MLHIPNKVSLQTHLASAYNSMLCLHSWFCHNGLAVNSTKPESILIGTRQRLRILSLLSHHL